MKEPELRDKHFYGLNYSFANEDSSLEFSVVHPGRSHILSIAGSGNRVIPLLITRPKYLTCVDVSKEQLFFTELRFESIRFLSYTEYLQFWGFPGFESSPEIRKKLFEKIESPASSLAKEYLLKIFEKSQWSSPLYLGKWEQTVKVISRVVRKFLGKKALDLFECKTLEDQRRFLIEIFPRSRWKLFIFTYSHFMALLWRLKPSRFPVKNTRETFYKTYKTSFEKMFQNTLARENFLLQMMFFGRLVYFRACSMECNPALYAQAKAALETTSIQYHLGDAVDAIATSKIKIDFVSFSNAPSYFGKKLNQSFLQKITPGLAEDASIVIRSFLHTIKNTDRAGYRDISSQFRNEIESEKTQSYEICIFQRRSNL